MTRPVLFTAASLFAVLALTACSGTSTTASSPVPTTSAATPGAPVPTTSAAQPTAVTSAAQWPADAVALRAETCRDWVESFKAARELNPAWSADRDVQATLAAIQTMPEWASWTAAQKTAVAQGVKDAAGGSC
ncbi:hypothetical protein [Nocardia tengchongensis]|uniref:hypothetical protein n=1 Tax=Nocardia tengchongensis TaxID=2055889 RepID=UPI00361951D9